MFSHGKEYGVRSVQPWTECQETLKVEQFSGLTYGATVAAMLSKPFLCAGINARQSTASTYAKAPSATISIRRHSKIHEGGTVPMHHVDYYDLRVGVVYI